MFTEACKGPCHASMLFPGGISGPELNFTGGSLEGGDGGTADKIGIDATAAVATGFAEICLVELAAVAEGEPIGRVPEDIAPSGAVGGGASSSTSKTRGAI